MTARLVRWTLLAGVAALLAGCGEEHGDLVAELRDIDKQVLANRKVEPLPAVKTPDPIPYAPTDPETNRMLPDPFGTAKIEIATKNNKVASALRPDEKRVKEPLESFPLDSLKMVGVLQQGKDTYAVVKADASLYRVKAGNYLGQNFGLITQITENEIKVRELVQDGNGWVERSSSLQLQEVTK